MSSKSVEATRSPVVAEERVERASKDVEKRVSLWVSQLSSNEKGESPSIADRRLSMHLSRRSQQGLLRSTISTENTENTTTTGTTEMGEMRIPSGEKEKSVKTSELPSMSGVEVEEVVTFQSDFHREMYILLTSYMVEMFILVVILINTLTLIIRASVDIKSRAGWYLEVMESVVLAIFVWEVLIKIYVFRGRYFFDVWNLVDFVIVTLNLIDLALSIAHMKLDIYAPTTVFRLLRILRSLRALHLFNVLRPFKFFSTMHVILVTIQRSAIPMSIIALMMMYVIYLFAVIGRGLYGEIDARFHSIPKTMFTLYLLLTLDDWYFINMDIEAKQVYHCFFYLFVYIFVNVYVFLNLFVAVICDNFQYAWMEEKEEQRQRKLKHTGSFTNMQEELEEHEDEDSLIDAVISGHDAGGSFVSEDDDDLNVQTIQDYYPDTSEGEQQLLERFFLTSAALEDSYFKLLEMQHVLNVLVDVAADAGEDVA